MSKHPIRVADLEAMAADSGIEFLAGDILLVRTGWTKWYDEHNPDERRAAITNGTDWVGVEGSQESVEWLWNHHFAAVGADSIGFEMVPWHPEWGRPL